MRKPLLSTWFPKSRPLVSLRAQELRMHAVCQSVEDSAALKDKTRSVTCTLHMLLRVQPLLTGICRPSCVLRTSL